MDGSIQNRLAFEDQRHFIGLLALKSDGTLDNECDEILKNRIVAQRLWIDHAIILDVKKRLINAGLIDLDWQPLAWDKRQFKSDRPPSHVWRELRTFVFARDNYTCQYCGEYAKKLECDHVIPVAHGGGHSLENLKTACFKCNRSKRDKLIEEWMSI